MRVIPFPYCERRARAHIGAPEGLVAWRMSVGSDEFALLELPEPSHEVDGARLKALTGAEADVVRHLLAGLSNAEVARRRGSSPRTVANQVASVFRKLGVGSRSELSALLARGPAAVPGGELPR